MTPEKRDRRSEGPVPTRCPECGANDVLTVTVMVVGQPLSATLCLDCHWALLQSQRQLTALEAVIDRTRRERYGLNRAVS